MSVRNANNQSPMMQQWQKCKQRAKGALLLFRCGDFFEAFHEDAKALAYYLDLTLTKRQEIPMAGVPAQTVDTSIERLLEKGLVVAIADQTEDAKNAKGLVKREITRIVSPATHMEILPTQGKRNNFFASAFQLNRSIGLCLLDVSTGEMIALELDTIGELLAHLTKQTPTELLLCNKFYQTNQALFDDLKAHLHFRLNLKETWHFNHQQATETLLSHFGISSLDAFGLRGMISAINAAGGLLLYLTNDLLTDVSHINKIEKMDPSTFLAIDASTARSLDLFTSASSHKGATLLDILDQTKTAMGARLLKNWLIHPLLDVTKIHQRQEAINELLTNKCLLGEKLGSIRDLDRLSTRIQTKIATPRDLRALCESLKQLPSLLKSIEKLRSPLFEEIHRKSFDFTPLFQQLDKTLVDNPPPRLSDGGIFRRGVHTELDQLRALNENNRSFLANYQMKLREQLDIKSLKVNFNRAFGYYIEVPRAQSVKMPDAFVRRQTLVSTERFISPELKVYEEKILTAQERISEIEQAAYFQLRDQVATYTPQLKQLARHIALIDTLHSLMYVAKQHHYVCPIVNEGDEIIITKGRHPVIENFIDKERFIPNDAHLNNDERNLMIITGPNMAGKSTYIRQVALIVIMAQIGSFVPATSATIGIVDKLFSRIGASDDLARGQSTFMVEMVETANILHNATHKSLVILDEIGRGTSTYDGISIALSVAEHLLEEIHAKTLFATHYFELTQLEQEKQGVKNLQVVVQENEDGILFLHKILEGMADKSYGIHVAALAGLPRNLIKRAKHHLQRLETPLSPAKPSPTKRYLAKNQQMLLFDAPNHTPLIEQEIAKINLDEYTPMQALQLLASWKKNYDL